MFHCILEDASPGAMHRFAERRHHRKFGCPNLTNDGAFCPRGIGICTRLRRDVFPQSGVNAYKPTMRWVIGLIVVLGIGLGSSWLLDPGSPAPPPPGSNHGSETTGSERERPDVQDSSFDDQAHANGASGSQGVPILRDDGASAKPSVPGPRVLVVRDDGGPQPVANAEVFFLGEAASERHRRAHNVTQWEAPELLGQSVRTDRDGIAQLPVANGRYLCAARTAGWFGFLVLKASPGDHTITLQPDEPLQIVARQQQAPAQPAARLPVFIYQEYRSGRAQELWRGVTDEHGRALVRHFQLLRRAPSSKQPEPFRERFAAVALMPIAPAVLTEFVGRPSSSEPILLQVPPTGQVSATLTDHAGRPLLSPAKLHLAIAKHAPTDGAFPLRGSALLKFAEKPVGLAAVTLPLAPLHQDVRVSAQFPDSRSNAVSIATGGPKVAGEQVAVSIAPAAGHVVLAGRFLLPDGNPVANQQVSLTIWRADAVHDRAQAATIADGQWDLVLDGIDQPARCWVAVRYLWQVQGEVVPEHFAEPETWLGCMVELPSYAPKQRIELGTITLTELPALAAGIVVDDRGDPVAGATIQVQQEQPQPAKASGSRARTPSGPDLVLSGNLDISGSLNWSHNSRSERWRTLRHLSTTSLADGSFAIYAKAPAGSLRVLANDQDHCSTSLPIAGTTSNLRLVIPRNGVVIGDILLPEWLPDGAIKVTARTHPVPGDQEATSDGTFVRSGLASDGSLVLQPLRPGRYDIKVQMRNLKTPMASIEDVVVQPGQNREPRLRALDLRQALHRYLLRAFDDAGQPLLLDGPIHARCQEPDGSYAEAGFRWQRGVAQLITVHANVELTFFGRGFEPRKQHYGPGEHDVFLKVLRPALVNLPGLRSLSGPTRKVRISALLQGDTGMPASLRGTDQITGRSFSFARWDLGQTSGGWLEQADLVEIPLMKAGTYQLLFRAHATESTNTPQTSVVLGSFELKPDGTTITAVPIDSEQISTALRAIDKQYEERQARNKTTRNR